MSLTVLSDDELVASLNALVREGRRILADVLAYLAEVEDRGLDRELGCSSLYDLCRRKLGFSEGESLRRMRAARLVRRFPKLLGAIAAGRIHLSNVLELAEVFTVENVDQLVELAHGKTKREVQELVAKMVPKPDVPSSIRRLPEEPLSLGLDAGLSPAPTEPTAPMAAKGATRPGGAESKVVPLSEGRYKVELTASASLLEKLDRARALTSHRNPSGDLAFLVERAIDALIEKLEKQKLGRLGGAERPGSRTKGAVSSAAGPAASKESAVVAKPGTRAASNPVVQPRSGAKRTGPSRSGYISRATRREVVARDGLQCSFVTADGERCPARDFLEFDHVQPRSLGGAGDAANVRMLCRCHNAHAAERVFGRAHIEEQIYRRQQRSEVSALRAPAESHTPPPSPPPPAQVSPPARPSPPRSRVPLRQTQTRSPREQVQGALLSLGFRAAEAQRALTAIDPTTFDRPLDILLREAVGILT